MQLPLFPLHAIVLPGGKLHLRIFETRYVDMVTNCFRDDSGFGVCLIRDGSEAGNVATPFPSGTEVSIVDWDKGSDGLLNIVALGQQRFTLLDWKVMPDKLLVGEVSHLPREPSAALPKEHRALSELLNKLLEQLPFDWGDDEKQLDDAGWVGNRLLEILPMAGAQKQHMIDCGHPTERLELLAKFIRDASASRN
ncbi:MAG: LON peptidase substrate-binding domain-containing protein [Pseudomonadota bacterium]